MTNLSALREQTERIWIEYKTLSDRAQTLDEGIAEPHYTETHAAFDRWCTSRAIWLNLPHLAPDHCRCCACGRPSLDIAPIPEEIAEAVDAIEGWGNLDEGECGGYCNHCRTEWQRKHGDPELYDAADEILEYRTH